MHVELYELSTVPGDSTGAVTLGERRLLVAVLRQTLDDLVEHRGRCDPMSRRIFDSAAAWIFAATHREADDHLSFSRTCDLLGLDATYVRGLVRRLLGGDVSRYAPETVCKALKAKFA